MGKVKATADIDIMSAKVHPAFVDNKQKLQGID